VTLTDRNGVQYEMNRRYAVATNGLFYSGCSAFKYLTTKITDTNGNYAIINYQNNEEISSITTSDGKTVTYEYANIYNVNTDFYRTQIIETKETLHKCTQPRLNR
jgi:uncharacterized protein YbcV (DUF1398 family)